MFQGNEDSATASGSRKRRWTRRCKPGLRRVVFSVKTTGEVPNAVRPDMTIILVGSDCRS